MGDVATLPLASFLRALRVIDADANVKLGDLGRFVHSLLRTRRGLVSRVAGPAVPESIAACLGAAVAKSAAPSEYADAAASDASLKAAAEAGEEGDVERPALGQRLGNVRIEQQRRRGQR